MSKQQDQATRIARMKLAIQLFSDDQNLPLRKAQEYLVSATGGGMRHENLSEIRRSVTETDNTIRAAAHTLPVVPPANLPPRETTAKIMMARSAQIKSGYDSLKMDETEERRPVLALAPVPSPKLTSKIASTGPDLVETVVFAAIVVLVSAVVGSFITLLVKSIFFE